MSLPTASTLTTPSSPPSSPAPSATTGPPRRSHPAARVSAHGGELELKLTHGTFRLNIADLDAKFVQGTSHEPVFPRTCSTYVSVSDPVPIVPGSTPGAYRGIAGTFAMSLTLNEVHGSPCTTSLSILRQVIVLSGAGKITER
jgi:hypothetical protein